MIFPHTQPGTTVITVIFMYIYILMSDFHSAPPKMADPSLPLRSDQHAQHSAMWIVPGFAFPKFCIACAITRLCQPEEVSFLKRKILTEFTAVFASEKGQAFAIFKEDPRVQHRLAFAALGILGIFSAPNI